VASASEGLAARGTLDRRDARPPRLADGECRLRGPARRGAWKGDRRMSTASAPVSGFHHVAYVVELTAKTERHDREMDPAQNGARATLAAWQRR